MADITKAVFDRLSNYSGLTALVAAGRMFPVKADQKPTRPYLVFRQAAAGPRQGSFDGDIGIADPRIIVDCYGETYISARGVSEQVRAALQRWSGTHASVVVLDSQLEDEIDDYDEDIRAFVTTLEFAVMHRE